MPDHHVIADLDEVDQHIADGERRISDIAARIEQGRAVGRDTSLAEELLRLMHETVEQWRIQRQLIVEALDREQRER
ncbi:hypothetical protein [Methylobacterium nodulans]|uniref:Uncharacterized protein n=1 Tax=Methylobacterium nodulans (strain LMG 21967 / CNCM I-2342 / ORS 2060) TaxID=460265 RepID=B8IXU6_METNO|nr:hypothetical protein [Methylobacterium nodulans]ACL63236.1 hypothetical protein Mnod_8775 [Methylobacterium nodulans ORS 2060]